MMLEMSQVAWQLNELGDAKDAAADWQYYIDAATAGNTTATNLGTEAGQPVVTMPSFVAGPPAYWRVNAKRAALSLGFSQIGSGACTWAYLFMPLTLDGTSRRFWSTGAGFGDGTDPGWSLFARSGVLPVVGATFEQTVASGGLFRDGPTLNCVPANSIMCVIARQDSTGANLDIWCNGIPSAVRVFTPAGSRNAANASEIGGLHGSITANLDHRLYRAAMSKVYLSDADVFATTKAWLSFVGVSL